uniref:Uncharacterized protein n=1 Tax=Cacopsylla melanoneura TaxID=428564 RepID=A0A8D9FDK9_9HEMI
MHWMFLSRMVRSHQEFKFICPHLTEEELINKTVQVLCSIIHYTLDNMAIILMSLEWDASLKVPHLLPLSEPVFYQCQLPAVLTWCWRKLENCSFSLGIG